MSDFHYLNPHLDGPVARPSSGRFGPVVLFIASLLFTILLGCWWYLMSASSRLG